MLSVPWTNRTQSSRHSSRSIWEDCPAKKSPNINMLTSLNTQLDATTQALGRMEQDKSYTESMIAQQQSYAPSGERGASAGPGAQQVELQNLQKEEADLTRRYTDDYPDVVAVRRRIKRTAR